MENGPLQPRADRDKSGSSLKRAYKALSRSGSGHHSAKKKDLLETKPCRDNFPVEWLQTPDVRPQEPITMTESFTSRLPRILILLHHATGLNIGKKGNVCLSQVVKGKFALTPIWNEEFRYRIEANSENPFLAHIWIYSAHPQGGPDTPLGYSEFDLYSDLGLRKEGDRRKWTFKLNTQGEVTLSFIAQTDLNFPVMDLRNRCGEVSTLMLPKKDKPELELTVYQCIDLKGEKPLQSYIKVEQFTYDLTAPLGTNPKRWKLLMRTGIFRGYSPFWGEKCKIVLNTKDDTIRISLIYVLGSSKTFQESEEEAAVLTVDEMMKGATSTESLLWYKFNDVFKGASIGIGLIAVTDVSVVETLPEAPLFFEEVRDPAGVAQIQVKQVSQRTLPGSATRQQQPQKRQKLQQQEDQSKLVRRSVILDNDITYNSWSEDEPSQEDDGRQTDNDDLVLQNREADEYSNNYSSTSTETASDSSKSASPKPLLQNAGSASHPPSSRSLSPEEQYKIRGNTVQTPEERYKLQRGRNISEIRPRSGALDTVERVIIKKTITTKKPSRKKGAKKKYDKPCPEEVYKRKNSGQKPHKKSAEEIYKVATTSAKHLPTSLAGGNASVTPPIPSRSAPPIPPITSVPLGSGSNSPQKTTLQAPLQRQQLQHQHNAQPMQPQNKNEDDWDNWEKTAPYADKLVTAQIDDEIRQQEPQCENNVGAEPADDTWNDWDSMHPDCAQYYGTVFYQNWLKENSPEEIEEEKIDTPVEGDSEWVDWDSCHPDCEEFYMPEFYATWTMLQKKEEGAEQEEEFEVEADGEWNDWDSCHPDCEKYYTEKFYHFWWANNDGDSDPEDEDANENADVQPQYCEQTQERSNIVYEEEPRGRDSADDRGRQRAELQEDEGKTGHSLKKLLEDKRDRSEFSAGSRASSREPKKGPPLTSSGGENSESPSRHLRTDVGRTSMGLLRSLSDNYEKNKSKREAADPYADRPVADSPGLALIPTSGAASPLSSSFSLSPTSSPSLSPIPPHNSGRTTPISTRTTAIATSVPHSMPPRWLSGADGHASARSPSSPPSQLTRQYMRSSSEKHGTQSVPTSPSGSSPPSPNSAPASPDEKRGRKIWRSSGPRPIRIAVHGQAQGQGSGSPQGQQQPGQDEETEFHL